MYAWEASFEQQVLDIRNREIKVLRKTAYLNAGSSFIWNCAPFVVRGDVKCSVSGIGRLSLVRLYTDKERRPYWYFSVTRALTENTSVGVSGLYLVHMGFLVRCTARAQNKKYLT